MMKTVWVVLLVGVSLFCLLVSVVGIYIQGEVATLVLPAEVNFTESTLGFDVNASALAFGKVSLGGSSTRTVLVQNDYSFPLQVFVEVEGTIDSVLAYEEGQVIPAGESLRLPFTALSTPDTFGEYTGTVTISLK